MDGFFRESHFQFRGGIDLGLDSPCVRASGARLWKKVWPSWKTFAIAGVAGAFAIFLLGVVGKTSVKGPIIHKIGDIVYVGNAPVKVWIIQPSEEVLGGRLRECAQVLEGSAFAES
jgi:hypothetical protein